MLANMSKFQRCLPAVMPEGSSTISEDVCSVAGDDIMQRDYNNDLLSQAISYLAAEGDDDPPALYIDRVSYIDVKLLQQLPTQDSSYDMKLYRRVRSMVRAVQREYEDAVDTSPDLIGDDDDVPELHLSSPVDALFRVDDEPEAPLNTPQTTKAEKERVFRYGGPNSEVEIWHKSLPNSLPFPETIRMQDWESMKVDFDLACSADPNITEPVLTNIPFNHSDLVRHDTPGQYESGSRFKLPEIDADDMKMVNQVGSVDKLRKVVSFFNHGEIGEAKDYAPRVFLEKMRLHPDTVVSGSVSPTTIRRSVNDTPTRSHPGSSSRVSTVSKSTRKLLEEPPAPTSTLVDNNTSCASSFQLSSPRTQELKAHGPSGPSTSPRASPAARRISRVVSDAFASSPTREPSHSSPRRSPAVVVVSSVVKRSTARSRTCSPTPTNPKTSSPSRKASANQKCSTSQDPTYKPRRSRSQTPESSRSPTPEPATMTTPKKASEKRKRTASQDPSYRPEHDCSPTPESSGSPTPEPVMVLSSAKSSTKRKRVNSQDPSYRPDTKRARRDAECSSSESGEDEEVILSSEEVSVAGSQPTISLHRSSGVSGRVSTPWRGKGKGEPKKGVR